MALLTSERRTLIEEALALYSLVITDVEEGLLQIALERGTPDSIARLARVTATNHALAKRGLSTLTLVDAPPLAFSLQPPPTKEPQKAQIVEERDDLSILEGDYGIVCEISLDQKAYSALLVQCSKKKCQKMPQEKAKEFIMSRMRVIAKARWKAKARLSL